MARTGGFHIQVSGDEAARAALIRAAGELQAEVAAVHKEVAGMIERETKTLMAEQMVSDDRTGRLERSVKGKGTPTQIKVTIGGRNVPYAGWWEFGGWTKSPIGNTHREIIQGGRSLFPTVKEKRPEIYAALDAVARKVAETIVGFRG